MYTRSQTYQMDTTQRSTNRNRDILRDRDKKIGLWLGGRVYLKVGDIVHGDFKGQGNWAHVALELRRHPLGRQGNLHIATDAEKEHIPSDWQSLYQPHKFKARILSKENDGPMCNPVSLLLVNVPWLVVCVRCPPETF